MPTLAVNPSEDGDIIVGGDDARGVAYSTVHNLASGTSLSTSHVNLTTGAFNDPDFVNESPFDPGYSEVERAFLSFDTSTIPASAGIKSAILTLRYIGKNKNGTDDTDLYIVEGIQTVPLALGDFGTHHDKTTSGGSVAYDSISGSFGITLNTTGRGWINKGGTTKLCLRIGIDISGATPTHSTLADYVAVASDNHATSSYRPLLTVTYSEVYPKSALGRVGSLVHRRDVEKGIYTLDITFGGIKAEAPRGLTPGGAVGTGGEVVTGSAGAPPIEPVLPTTKRLRIGAGPFPGTEYEKLGGLTRYGQTRAEELFQLGFIDKNGLPTAEGLAWAKQHPNEAAPAVYPRLGISTGVNRDLITMQRIYGIESAKIGAAGKELSVEEHQYASGTVPLSPMEQLTEQASSLNQRLDVLIAKRIARLQEEGRQLLE